MAERTIWNYAHQPGTPQPEAVERIGLHTLGNVSRHVDAMHYPVELRPGEHAAGDAVRHELASGLQHQVTVVPPPWPLVVVRPDCGPDRALWTSREVVSTHEARLS